MTGLEMINNVVEIFGASHIWAYQIKNVVRNYGEGYAKIFYDSMIESERASVETQLLELQKRLDKLNKM